jgi:hypothetical protein
VRDLLACCVRCAVLSVVVLARSYTSSICTGTDGCSS